MLERIAGLGNLGHRHRPARNDTLPPQHETHSAHPGRRTGLYAARPARPRGGRSAGLQRGPARPRGHHGQPARRRPRPVARHRRHRQRGRRRAARRADADQPVREPGARAGPGGAEPPELRSGPADLGARLRCALHLWRARAAPVRGRHSGRRARRPGPGRQLHAGQRRAPGRGARPGRRALRQQRRRRTAAVHRRRRGTGPVAQRHGSGAGRAVAPVHPAARHDRWRKAGPGGWRLRPMALCHPHRALRHRRHAPPVGRRPQHGPHEAVTQAGRRPVAAAVPGAARQRPGPAGPDTRRVRGRPRPDHGQRAALQYAQKRAPAPAGRRLAAPVRRGPAPGTHGLCGYALRAAVPVHSRGHAGTALAFRRRDRPGPRLRRHEPALAQHP